MKWTFQIRNKMLASAALLGLCLLVLLSHYLERVYAQNVTDSMSTMYEDRLVAEHYILKMTHNVYQIREILKTNLDEAAKSEAVEKHLVQFDKTYLAYSKTKLTRGENASAVQLVRHVKNFKPAFLANEYQPSPHTQNALAALDRLSAIQLEESKSIMKEVESQYATIKASSQFAFAIIILILIVLQVIVFSSPALVSAVKPSDPRLN